MLGWRRRVPRVRFTVAHHHGRKLVEVDLGRTRIVVRGMMARMKLMSVGRCCSRVGVAVSRRCWCSHRTRHAIAAGGHDGGVGRGLTAPLAAATQRDHSQGRQPSHRLS